MFPTLSSATTNTTQSASARSKLSRISKNRWTCRSCVIAAAPRIIWMSLTASGPYFKPSSHWRRRETMNTRAWSSYIRHSAAGGSKPAVQTGDGATRLSDALQFRCVQRLHGFRRDLERSQPVAVVVEIRGEDRGQALCPALDALLKWAALREKMSTIVERPRS